MGTDKKATEVRRQEMASAALQLISEHGLNGLSVARIARHVGLVPSAIYRHFKSKDEVLDAVYDLIEGKMTSNLRGAWASSAKTVDRLHLLLRLNIRMIIEYPAIPRLAFGEGIYGNHPERRARMYRLIRNYLSQIQKAVTLAQGKGELRSDVPASVIAASFWGLIPPAALLWSASEGGYDITTLVEREWTLFEEIATLHQHRHGTEATGND